MNQFARILTFTFFISCIAMPVYAAKSGKPVSLDQAVVLVKKETGAKVLSAKEVSKEGKQYYLIKTIDNGRVRLLRIDPKTGEQY